MALCKNTAFILFLNQVDLTLMYSGKSKISRCIAFIIYDWETERNNTETIELAIRKLELRLDPAVNYLANLEKVNYSL